MIEFLILDLSRMICAFPDIGLEPLTFRNNNMENLPEFISNHLFLVSLLFGLLIMLMWNLYGSTMSGIQQLSPSELTRMINHENAILFDVRNSDDFESGHIINAKNFPGSELDTKEKELEKYKDKTVIAYCIAGMTSPKVARILKGKQFEQVYVLKGGIQAWQSANLPLSKDSK
jgi:rhodanese-related sulfurtransferase